MLQGRGTYLFPQVLNITSGCTEIERLAFGGLEVVFLAQIGHEADDFVSPVLLTRRYVDAGFKQVRCLPVNTG